MYTHQKQKTPLTWENVPEVGLEPDSSPCKHWEVKETSPIQASPTRSDAQGVHIVHNTAQSAGC